MGSAASRTRLRAAPSNTESRDRAMRFGRRCVRWRRCPVGDPEIAEARLLPERTRWPEVVVAEPGARFVYDPDTQRIRYELLPIWRSTHHADLARPQREARDGAHRGEHRTGAPRPVGRPSCASGH